MSDINWQAVVEGAGVNTGVNSQIKSSLSERVDGLVVGVVTLRKWARYCTAKDKMMGLSKEEVPFRPTKDGVSFPFSVIPQIITELQTIYDYALINGIEEYDPNEISVQK